jgi:hypothetical protein
MPADQSYRDRLLTIYDDTIESLEQHNIPREVVDYRVGYRTPRRPTAAHSDFLINRQFGDWTETLLRTSFNAQVENYKAVRYGAGGNLIAGDPGFIEMFTSYHAEIRRIGKRPDLLIFDRDIKSQMNLPDDISEFESSGLVEIARRSARALEVRSSRYLAARYRQVKEKDQSFTPKLEDLPILTHWIAEHGIPCFYTQVFFDEAYMISFEKILEIICDTGVEHIDKVARNQGKSTFYIPVSEGILIGQVIENPRWTAETKYMSDGRVIIYTTPSGGKMELRREILQFLDL